MMSKEEARKKVEAVKAVIAKKKKAGQGDAPTQPLPGGTDALKNGHSGEVVSVVSLCRPEPYAPFPTDALPPVLRQLAEEGAESMGCDPSYIALPALAVAAAAIGNSRSICLKDGDWYEPAILWATVVGDSGTLKTPAFKLALGAVQDLQKKWIEEYNAACAEYQNLKLAWLLAAKQAKDAGEEPPEEPEQPTLKRLYCSDITIEKLAEVLEDNPHGVLIARDELSAWVGSFTRYKSQKGATDLPNYLEMYNAGPIIYDRKTGDKKFIYVSRAVASIAGGIQPGVLAKLFTQEHFDSGLVARLLLAMPPKRRKRWSEARVSAKTREAYACLVERLTELSMTTVKGDALPDRLLLTKGAKRRWVEWYDEWADVQYESEGEQAAADAKIEGVAARLALVHYVVSECVKGDKAEGRVDEESMEAGIRLARWFAAESRRVYASLRQTAEERALVSLLEWLERFVEKNERPATPRDLQHSTKKYDNAAAAKDALDELVRFGLATCERSEPGEKGGRPTYKYAPAKHPADTTTQPTEPTEPTEPGGDEESEVELL